jgi:hypothetical protein
MEWKQEMKKLEEEEDGMRVLLERLRNENNGDEAEKKNLLRMVWVFSFFVLICFQEQETDSQYDEMCGNMERMANEVEEEVYTFTFLDFFYFTVFSLLLFYLFLAAFVEDAHR